MNSYFGFQHINVYDLNPHVSNDHYFCMDENMETEWQSLDTFIAIVYITIAIMITFGTLLDILQNAFSNYKTRASESLGTKMILSFSLYSNFKVVLRIFNQCNCELLLINNHIKSISLLRPYYLLKKGVQIPCLVFMV